MHELVYWSKGARAVAYTLCGHRLRSVGNVAGTKLNGAAKGATLLQLISLSTDVSQGPYGVYVPARARLLAETEKAVGQKEESVSELLLDWLGCWLRLKKQHGRKRRVWASCFWLGLFARTKKACIGCP